jgi:hypothetical protein
MYILALSGMSNTRTGGSEMADGGPVTVVVVGVLNRQFRRVEQKWGRKVRFRYVDKDSGKTRLPAGDWVLVAEGWCDHRWSERAFRDYPRDRVRHVGKGTSAFDRALADILGLNAEVA